MNYKSHWLGGERGAGGGGGVVGQGEESICSLANYSVAYEETQTNQVSAEISKYNIFKSI